MDPFSPVKGNCTWWREVMVDEDVHLTTLKQGDKRVRCTCFVEGYYWVYRSADVPSLCPRSRHCRYYIKLR
ncbi:MAG TPA: hypothetical protein VFH17_07545 [Coriobacteriia bacterium]|nr:hypothetical protein [Coriobacteriia bacterium]